MLVDSANLENLLPLEVSRFTVDYFCYTTSAHIMSAGGIEK